MLIDFIKYQLQQFDNLASRILPEPEKYVQFDSVSDFYKEPWLDDFPQGTTWAATGLDDGAEEFYAIIRYKNHYLEIHHTQYTTLKFGIHDSGNVVSG
ncbi:hypothetical protein [Acinetobacter sp. ANC 4648]|uniref:hypothetical protein n=1 Tax=Acinetobacter sp. ANC 4648 TaxID=1977875 RepID=UPI000A34A4D0|nr:hypothetical protein [Acinetobacter sp. ANC 4648]OTG83797.1 hypothetical protein B9T27_04635 [Acinetobacter sp. ANC 4648]